jgi:hypothetical protein
MLGSTNSCGDAGLRRCRFPHPFMTGSQQRTRDQSRSGSLEEQKWTTRTDHPRLRGHCPASQIGQGAYGYGYYPRPVYYGAYYPRYNGGYCRRIGYFRATTGRVTSDRARPVTGQAYYGWGFVQLTWRDNYSRADRYLGLDADQSCE